MSVGVSTRKSSSDNSDVDIARDKLTKKDLYTGIIILLGAQLAAASTATCVKALPAATPSVLRGLWRQTLTSLIFTPLTAAVLIYQRPFWNWNGPSNQEDGDKNHEQRSLLADKGKENDFCGAKNSAGNDRDIDMKSSSSTERLICVAVAILGATILNDTIVVALEYASAAAVMCLCNTTPMWLIFYSIIRCDPPGAVTICSGVLAFIGAVICAVGGGSEEEGNESASAEAFGSLVATTGGIGAAMYMMACRKLSPLGLHPVVLTLLINIGMMLTSFVLCLFTIEGGVAMLSTDVTNGFFGFLNPVSRPAALLQSVFPDCFGNFGIMMALSYFDPLIVSMVMLTEPLNASVIAMAVIGEAPPPRATVVGVSVVLLGCAIVLWESSKEGLEAAEMEKMQEEGLKLVSSHLPPETMEAHNSTTHRRRNSQVILFSPIGTIAPDVTATAALREPQIADGLRRNLSLTVDILRNINMTEEERAKSFSSLHFSFTSKRSNTFSWSRSTSFGSFHEVDKPNDDEEEVMFDYQVQNVQPVYH